jgi:beta-phosphoglucomutase-like phosphatase (HAD superfamily)
MQHLGQHYVEVYEASIELVRTLRAQEIKTAVVSSSKNCAAVLEAADKTWQRHARPCL